MDSEQLLRAAVVEDTRTWHGSTVHPAPEELLAYQSGKLPVAHKETLQEHLALCRSCARAVLDLETFPDVEPLHEDQVSDWQVTAEWWRLREKKARRRASSIRFSYALAASLLVATFGLSLWVTRLHGRLGRPSPPTVNVHVADLIPQDVRERGLRETIRAPAGTQHVLLLLNLGDVRSFPAYRVGISELEEGEKEVWASREIRRSPDGYFTLEIDRQFLSAGDYRIVLEGLDDETETPVATYTFEIVYD